MPPKTIWPTRVQPSRVPDCALFPLPSLVTDGGGNGKSRTAHRRRVARAKVFDEVNYSIECLNQLYGCNPSTLTSVPSAAQQSVQSRLVGMASQNPLPVHEPRAAARQLLGGHLSYDGSITTVETYLRDRVSLPREGLTPVTQRDVLPKRVQSLLTPSHVLADEDVVIFRQQQEPITCYCDKALAADPILYQDFLARLISLGLLGACARPKGKVTPFFVKKEK